ncbi:replication protein A 70 kDa DNA-binding subunit B [Tanacetum coccineum]
MSLKWAHKSNGDTVNNRSDDANILSTAIESFTKVEHIEDEEMEFTCHLDQIPLVCDFHLKRFDRKEWSLASEALVSVDLLKDSFMSWVLILNVSCDVEVYDIAVGSFVFPKKITNYFVFNPVVQTMEQQLTLLCDIDPMMDDVKVPARCISIWAVGKPNEPWGLDVVLQDPEGNRIQASIKLENMNKFLAVLDEGSCYIIGNFGVDTFPYVIDHQSDNSAGMDKSV